jgi:predicted AlkP superfamily pyrophosphatase or phosphodiesterase
MSELANRSRHCTLLLLPLLLCIAPALAADAPARYVIHVSVDGLAPRFVDALVAEGQLPTFKRFQQEGAWTHNARTDFDYTNTLPNHTCMVTGRPVKDKPGQPAAIAGHIWLVNSDPGDATLHSRRHDYVSSTFDVAHDHGLRTCMLAGKSKFVLYDQSFNERNGAPDKTGDDNGRDKIDFYQRERDAALLVGKFIDEMKANPIHYAFLHFHDTDTAGHAKTWGSPQYLDALKAVDAALGRIVELVSTDERFKGKTTIILSADHGGTGLDHGLSSNPLNYTIPFYVWGAGVAAGKDLYQLNTSTRANPEGKRPDYTDAGLQPIRNGDGANLALMLLGLPPIPGAVINARQDLAVGEK